MQIQGLTQQLESQQHSNEFCDESLHSSSSDTVIYHSLQQSQEEEESPDGLRRGNFVITAASHHMSDVQQEVKANELTEEENRLEQMQTLMDMNMWNSNIIFSLKVRDRMNFHSHLQKQLNELESKLKRREKSICQLKELNVYFLLNCN